MQLFQCDACLPRILFLAFSDFLLTAVISDCNCFFPCIVAIQCSCLQFVVKMVPFAAWLLTVVLAVFLLLYAAC